MNQTWHIVTIEIESGSSDDAAGVMYELGCNGASEEASDNPGLQRLVSYFDSKKFNRVKLLHDISNALENELKVHVESIDIVTDAVDDWQKKWRQWFKPFEIAEHIVVTPSWEQYSAKDDESVITLDPGMAFGTGLHATTKLCAQAIDRIQRGMKSPTVLDVGTGSGLLAIVARKLGIENINTVEIDRDAVEVAKENFKINGTSDIDIVEDVRSVDGTYDIVVANILLKTLVELKDELIKRVSPDGYLILSGITHDQEEEIQSEFGSDLNFVETDRMDEWSCMVFRR